MRHLRLFEEYSDSDKYYFEVTGQDFTESNSKVINFDKLTVKNIKSWGLRIINHAGDSKSLLLFGDKKYYYVSMLEDEWFEVYVDNKFYKCDQLDGLKRFFTDRGEFKNS